MKAVSIVGLIASLSKKPLQERVASLRSEMDAAWERERTARAACVAAAGVAHERVVDQRAAQHKEALRVATELTSAWRAAEDELVTEQRKASAEAAVLPSERRAAELEAQAQAKRREALTLDGELAAARKRGDLVEVRRLRDVVEAAEEKAATAANVAVSARRLATSERQAKAATDREAVRKRLAANLPKLRALFSELPVVAESVAADLDAWGDTGEARYHLRLLALRVREGIGRMVKDSAAALDAAPPAA